MPLVRADVPEGTPGEAKARLREAIKAAVKEALAPRETRYVYVAVREVFAEIGDGAPSVTVDLRPGREAARKQALAEGIGRAFDAAMGVDLADVYLLFREAPAADHYCGGEPLAEWRPAS